MDVILLERVEKLGQMGDVVKVKDGYARNYLLPQNKALRATSENRDRFEQTKVQLEANNLERRNEAEMVAEKLKGQSFAILRQAGESGQLYGSVTTRDIAQQITEGGFTTTRNQVSLERPIKEIGMHDVKISLHPEVSVIVKLNVARTEEEAGRQARGESATADDEAGDAVLAAEEVFETEDLAKAAEEELAEDQESADDEPATTAEAPASQDAKAEESSATDDQA